MRMKFYSEQITSLTLKLLIFLMKVSVKTSSYIFRLNVIVTLNFGFLINLVPRAFPFLGTRFVLNATKEATAQSHFQINETIQSHCLIPKAYIENCNRGSPRKQLRK